MLAMWVKVRVKAEERERFLKAIEADAIGSEQDEPGCLRFNVLRDQQDQNVYYFFEVYRNEAALEAHRAAPHYAVWRAAADTLDGPATGDALRHCVSRGGRVLGKAPIVRVRPRWHKPRWVRRRNEQQLGQSTRRGSLRTLCRRLT